MSKQSTDSIKKEIASLTKRRIGLAAELEKANQENEAAQTELLASGSDDAMKAAAAAHARSSALEHAVATLDEALVKKQQELEAATIYEQQAGMRARMAELDREMDASLTKYRQGRIEIHKTLETVVPVTVDAWQQLMAQRREYQYLLQTTEGRGTKLHNRVDGIEALQPFGHLVDQALECHARIAHNGTREERKARFTEQRKREKERLRRIDEERNARRLEANKRSESGWIRTTDRAAQEAA